MKARVVLEDLIGGHEGNAEWVRLGEAERVEHVRGFGAVPEGCGPAVQPSVARGPVRAVDMEALYPDGDEGFALKSSGFLGRKTLVAADVFDRMRAQVARRGGHMVLTSAQIEMGRLYAATVERHEAGAVRCSSLEARGGGSGLADGFTDARLESARRIDLWRKRVGAGLAMEVKRARKVRPSARARVSITARQLVDGVCLGDDEVSKVLARYGWAVKGETVRSCTVALGALLEQMAGPVRRGEILSLRTDRPGVGVW